MSDGSHVQSRGDAMAGPNPEAVDVLVRAARREDLARLWELLLGLAEYERLTVAGTRERLGELLFGGSSLEALVAERDGRLIGYAIVYPRYSSFGTVSRL